MSTMLCSCLQLCITGVLSFTVGLLDPDAWLRYEVLLIEPFYEVIDELSLG